MTSIDDLAEDTGDVYLARNADRMTFRLESRDTVPYDEIGTDSFPQYGDFVPVGVWHPPEERFVEGCYLECTRELAKVLIDYGIETGDVFKIDAVDKDGDGIWRYTVSVDPAHDERTA